MDFGIELTDIQLKQCWDAIESMKDGEIVTVAKLVKSKPDLWVEAAKRHIHFFNSGYFNSDYTVFKKLTYKPIVI